MEILLVRVETEDGFVGWGEAFGHAAIHVHQGGAGHHRRAAGDRTRQRATSRASPRDVLHAVHLLGRNGPFVFAFSGIEIALWDIRGKRAGQPLHALLGGGSGARTSNAYASLLRYGDPALVAQEHGGCLRARLSLTSSCMR